MEARSKGDLVLAYRAAILLRLLTGWGWRRVWRTLRELGFEVSPDTVRYWFYRGGKPYFTPTAFEKSLFYHIAYELVVKTAAKHPDWGPRRVATHVSKFLPIRIPPLTVYFWMKGLSKPNVTLVKPTRALGYLVGVLVGDYTRSKKGKGLHVKDREFVRYYAKMYEEVTGIRPEACLGSDGYYHTYENAAWLKELWYSGLWKVVAYAYPLEFLKGLYDSEGTIIPCINKENGVLTSVRVTLAIGNPEVKDFVKKLLTAFGFRIKERYKPPRPRVIKGQETIFGECWEIRFYGWESLQRFAKLISFREGKRRQRLELLLKIRHLPPKERYKEWTRHYAKASNGHWAEQAPTPRPDPFSPLHHIATFLIKSM